MANFKNLEDLFQHQLKDIYNAETQLISTLPEMEETASNTGLQDAFSKHLKETKSHKERLEEISESLDMDLMGERCEAMQGLIKEARAFNNADVNDAGLIANAQRIEHYEISAYGTAVQ